jgi:hypothetical protein
MSLASRVGPVVGEPDRSRSKTAVAVLRPGTSPVPEMVAYMMRLMLIAFAILVLYAVASWQQADYPHHLHNPQIVDAR